MKIMLQNHISGSDCIRAPTWPVNEIEEVTYKKKKERKVDICIRKTYSFCVIKNDHNAFSTKYNIQAFLVPLGAISLSNYLWIKVDPDRVKKLNYFHCIWSFSHSINIHLKKWTCFFQEFMNEGPQFCQHVHRIQFEYASVWIIYIA